MGSVLIVDDVAGNVRLVESLLAPDGHAVRSAGDGAEALRLVRAEPPDLILMDVLMPNMDGFQACRALKQDLFTRLIPVVLVTSLDDSGSRLRGIEAGADDFISKPFNGPELRARVRSLLRIKLYTDDLESADAVIVSLALTIEARDSMTEGHCQRLARYAVQLGTALGLAEDDLSALTRGGFLHDIGKVGIPDAILLKPSSLTADEWKLIKEHPVVGERICAPLKSFRFVLPIIRHHHEKFDGSGYPDGLRGEAIPITARVLQVVDVYDALTTDRPYKRAFSITDALQTMKQEVAKGWWDPHIFDQFERLVRGGTADFLSRSAAAGAGS